MTKPLTTQSPHLSLSRTLVALGLATVCAVGAVLPAGAATPGTSAADPPEASVPGERLALPAPTGPHRVGEVSLHLVDRSRPDPWLPEQGQRELMVSVFYPADRTAGRPAAPYMLPAAADHFDSVAVNGYLQLNVPHGVAWAETVTQVVTGAPVAEGHGRRLPVVVYSPGLGEPRTWSTTLVADLASRGHVVVTIDNTYESPEVQFPDGSLATWTPPTAPEEVDPFLRKALAVRVADTSFVLDQLEALSSGRREAVQAGHPQLPPGLAGAIDLSRVGMFGHSAGGTAAAWAMAADHRIGAGLDMDGNLTLFDGSLMDVARDGLDRPFLLMGQDDGTETAPGWDAFRANTDGWSRQVRLIGSEHASFTDAEALLPQLALSPDVQAAALGTIDPATAVRTTEAYVSAYFDHWLRGRDGRLLDGPSPQYPEMEFVD